MMKIFKVILSAILMVAFLLTSVGFASVPVQSIKLSADKIKISVGMSYSLKVIFTPKDATNKKLVFSSMNKNVAIVDKNGKITARKEGSTAIMVTSSDNKKASVKFKITVAQSAREYSFNKTGYPIVKQKITLKMMGSKHPFHIEWKDMYLFKLMEEKTNIHFEFDTPPAIAIIEKFNLALASGDLPDVFLGTNCILPAVEVTYGQQGVLLPLEGLIEEYGTNIKYMFSQNIDVKPSVTLPNGHIYALPEIVKHSIAQAVNTIWVNGEWMQNLGITKLPETTDELYTFLKNFKENDANKNSKPDEIPLTSFLAFQRTDLAVPIFPEILSAFGLISGGIEVKNGIVDFAPIQPNYKEYLKYLQRLYQEKLLDNEAYSQSYQQMVAKGKENKVGMAVAAVPSICFMSDSVIHKILPVLTSPVNTEKMFPITQGINRGSFAITKNNKYPEATMRWVDYLYSLEGSMLMHYSAAGTYWNWADDTKTTRKVNTPPPGLALGQVRGQLTPAPGNVVPKWTPVEIQKSFVDPFGIHRYAEVDSKLMPYGRFMFPLVYNTVDEQKKVDVIYRDLITYINTMDAKFITGQESLDKWDDYVNTIKRMGVDDLVKINQSVYDRWEIAN